MGLVKSYSIEGANLVLTESLFWSFEANRHDSIRTWTLLNFDKASITTEDLEKLVDYQEDADFEEKINSGKKQLSISTYLYQSEYRIICDDIVSEIRPYNSEELTDIILKHQLHSTDDNRKIINYSQFIGHLKDFLENERVKKERILVQSQTPESEAVLKAKAKLGLITQLMNLITEFEHKK
ncbi:hypothetical protein [Rufibacter sp. XAAS-G3-1]|uniref:hypothetical protein n=1 Tax=Rufibacter sp. XAAS-G3-1 TaxID=2729134 RepID=UPI0015E6FCAA|nr:hypothetical protein [Rufibacter sp. XAAS-G3-1]